MCCYVPRFARKTGTAHQEFIYKRSTIVNYNGSGQIVASSIICRYRCRVHVRTSIVRRNYSPRLIIQQYHQRERLPTTSAASGHAVLLYMVGSWVGASVMGGCLWLCC